MLVRKVAGSFWVKPWVLDGAEADTKKSERKTRIRIRSAARIHRPSLCIYRSIYLSLCNRDKLFKLIRHQKSPNRERGFPFQNADRSLSLFPHLSLSFCFLSAARTKPLSQPFPLIGQILSAPPSTEPWQTAMSDHAYPNSYSVYSLWK